MGCENLLHSGDSVTVITRLSTLTGAGRRRLVQASRLKAVAVGYARLLNSRLTREPTLVSFPSGGLSGLRSRSLLWVVALVLLVAPQLARAETGNAAPVTCGKTIAEKLATAQRALQSNDATAHVALACLIEATIDLNDRVQADASGQQESGMLRAPVRADKVPPGP